MKVVEDVKVRGEQESGTTYDGMTTDGKEAAREFRNSAGRQRVE